MSEAIKPITKIDRLRGLDGSSLKSVLQALVLLSARRSKLQGSDSNLMSSSLAFFRELKCNPVDTLVQSMTQEDRSMFGQVRIRDLFRMEETPEAKLVGICRGKLCFNVEECASIGPELSEKLFSLMAVSQRVRSKG